MLTSLLHSCLVIAGLVHISKSFSENCTEPDPVKLDHIQYLQTRPTIGRHEVYLTYTPGDPHCGGKTSHTMHYVSNVDTDTVSCSYISRSCKANLIIYTPYTISIKTTNSIGLSSTLTLEPWWFPNPAITPSPPTKLQSEIRLINGVVSVKWTWAPPQQPNGVITDYDYRLVENNREGSVLQIFDSVKQNLSYVLDNVPEEYNISMEIQARTKFMSSEYSAPSVITIPSKDLPLVKKSSVLAYIPVSSSSSYCMNVSLTTSFGGNSISIIDTIQTKITCEPPGCSSDSCSVTLADISEWTTREPVISVCGLKPCISYNCTMGFSNAYNLSREDSYRFIVQTKSTETQACTPKPSPGISTGVVIGAIIATVVVLALLVAGITLIQRRKLCPLPADL